MSVLLVRHTAVARHWAGRCYGRSDVGLSREGLGAARALARTLIDWRADHVVHSGLRRTRHLAELAGLACVPDPAWQERDFGQWEGQSWRAIYRATGNAMDGMVDDPHGFRPGGGETTAELATRAMAALNALPRGRTLVITHGGPIAAILGTLRGLAVHDWHPLVPAVGAMVEID